MNPRVCIDEIGSAGKHGSEAPAGGPTPRPLSYWREHFTKHGWHIVDHSGAEWPVSLDAWEEADDSTLLAIYVKWVDPNLVGTTDPYGLPPEG
ncbi:MAG: hypothetical protein QM679_12860 [Patulibacter sp.]